MKKFVHNKNVYFCELNIALIDELDESNFHVELHHMIEQGVDVSVKYFNQFGLRYCNIKLKYSIHTLINTKNSLLGFYLEADFMNRKRTMHKNPFIH